MNTMIKRILCLICAAAFTFNSPLSAMSMDMAHEVDPRDLNPFDLMQRTLGRWEQWDYRINALFTALCVKYGLQQEGWVECILPQEGDMQEADALKLAHGIVTDVYGLSEQSLSAKMVGTSFVKDEHYGKGPIWIVYYSDGTEERYQVVISHQGELLSHSAPGQAMYTADEQEHKGMRIISPGSQDAGAQQAIYAARRKLSNSTEMGALARLVETHGGERLWLVYFYLEGIFVYQVLLDSQGKVLELLPSGSDFAYFESPSVGFRQYSNLNGAVAKYKSCYSPI